MTLPMLKDKKKKGDMIKTFKIFHQTDEVHSNHFFEISKERSMRGHKKLPSKNKSCD